MEMHERIKELRKEHLHLSQTEFGEKLGVSRSVINNIERNALARPDQKLSLIKLMCSVFNVSEEWIIDGKEPMFIETPSSTMDQLKKEFNLDDFSYNLVYQYLKLDADQRQAVRDFFYNVVESGSMDEDLFGDVPKTPEELEKEFPPVEEKPERNKERARRLKRPALPIRLRDQQVYLRPSIKFQIIIHCFAICVIDRVNAAAFVFYVFNYH